MRTRILFNTAAAIAVLLLSVVTPVLADKETPAQAEILSNKWHILKKGLPEEVNGRDPSLKNFQIANPKAEIVSAMEVFKDGYMIAWDIKYVLKNKPATFDFTYAKDKQGALAKLEGDDARAAYAAEVIAEYIKDGELKSGSRLLCLNLDKGFWIMRPASDDLRVMPRPINPIGAPEQNIRRVRQ